MFTGLIMHDCTSVYVFVPIQRSGLSSIGNLANDI